jgi:DNA-binding transcriptional MerR regulator
VKRPTRSASTRGASATTSRSASYSRGDRTAGGYRDYGADDVERLTFIRSAQRLCLSVDDIRESLAFRERGEQPCRYVLDVVRQRTDEVDRQSRELLELREELTELAARADQADAGVSRYCRLVETTHERAAGRS